MPNAVVWLCCLGSCLVVLTGCGTIVQDVTPLPPPSGPYAVGRTSFHWTDLKRPEVLTASPDDLREVVVHVWYPAATSTEPAAAYFPEASRLSESTSAEVYSSVFQSRWRSILNEQLRSHARENVPVTGSLGDLGVLIFSPGGGLTSIAYTIQLEDLASRGYVVLGVEHTYHVPAVVAPGGRVIAASDAQKVPSNGNNLDPEAAEKGITETLAVDIVFAIDKVHELNESNFLFRSRLDLTRVGVFGHSRGGRAAARVCQLDRRVKACANQDGMMYWQPFWLDERGNSMSQPFMMLDHLDPDPPDEAYLQMGTTRQAWLKNRAARRETAREQIFQTIESGSYQVTLTTPGISHNSFSDLRLLGRPDGGNINLWPKAVQDSTPHLPILRRIVEFTAAFFDKYLLGKPAPILDVTDEAGSDVNIQRYRTK